MSAPFIFCCQRDDLCSYAPAHGKQQGLKKSVSWFSVGTGVWGFSMARSLWVWACWQLQNVLLSSYEAYVCHVCAKMPDVLCFELRFVLSFTRVCSVLSSSWAFILNTQKVCVCMCACVCLRVCVYVCVYKLSLSCGGPHGRGREFLDSNSKTFQRLSVTNLMTSADRVWILAFLHRRHQEP